MKYYIIAFLSGFLNKFYDDITDNDIIKNKKLEKYLQQISKILFTIVIVLLSIKYPIFLITFIIINLQYIYFGIEDYDIYEFSGLLSLIIIIPFIDWNNLGNLKENIIIITILFLVSYFSEIYSGIINYEFGYHKLFQRFTGVLLNLGIFVINYKYKLYNDNFVMFNLALIGYLLTSSIFQSILIIKNNNTDNLIIKNNELKKLKQ
jgi:hypothetical protein